MMQLMGGTTTIDKTATQFFRVADIKKARGLKPNVI